MNGRRVKEVLFHSLAGTGKSVGIAANFVEWCLEFPNTRILILRKTLKSLRESWQVTFEKLVAPRYGIKTPESSRKSRENYVFANGSEIVLGGLDDPEKWRSTEWNVIWFVEGTEVTEKEFEEVTRGLRWSQGTPFRFKGLEVNPKSQFHWIYTRFFGERTPEEVQEERRIETGRGRVAFRCTFQDNPHYWNLERNDFTPAGKDYYENNDTGYSGVDHDRMVKGLWCADDGLVYPEFNPRTHVFDGALVLMRGTWWIDLRSHGMQRVLGFFHTQDWGIDQPGCAQVWAVDTQQRMCLVREWYHTGWNSNRWAGIHHGQVQSLSTRAIVCDGAQRDSIDILNDLLGPKGLRSSSRIAVGATGEMKDRLAGRSLVASKLQERRSGIPCIYFLKKTLQHPPDPSLRSLPKSTIQEFPGYVMEADKEGMSRDMPVKKNDHGMDAMKYGVRWLHNHHFSTEDTAAAGFYHTPWMDEDDALDAEMLEMYQERHNRNYYEDAS
ncbi:MAG: hypothetical protein H6830_04530 [Planctomycetes bacterium]|nr:hypothetical protein [Planctomycetota bacterium]MCB9910510.1 hypothetical protein [Planctomycetota bacterium]MCB9912636.1 hypothetical protein [Planctomycetota bacterium]